MSVLGPLRLVAWIGTGFGLLLLARVVVGPVLALPGTGEVAAVPRDTEPWVAPPHLDSAASVVAGRDLFRRSRRPGPKAPAAGESPAPPSPRPVLRLVGILTGAHPTAVVLGFPGVPGLRVVQLGDVVGPLTVQSISGDEVRVSGLDTVWVLTLPRHP